MKVLKPDFTFICAFIFSFLQFLSSFDNHYDDDDDDDTNLVHLVIIKRFWFFYLKSF